MGGNGGFSLRKTEAFLRVVSSSRYKFSKFVSECGKKYLKLNSLYSKIWKFQKKCLQKTKVYRYTKQNVVKFRRNDDRFWADNAKKYYPEFTRRTAGRYTSMKKRFASPTHTQARDSVSASFTKSSAL